MPKLVNRGPAGLLGSLHHDESPDESKQQLIPVPDAPINKIADALLGAVIDINSVIPDPINARLHPIRNMESIKDSLKLYGQLKPIVVRKDKMLVVAGNGTLEAAKQLGWTRIAATITEMDDITAAGYGLADNRTAELAKWDFEVVARLDALLLEAKHASVGWTLDELEVLRAADWTPPTMDDGDAFKTAEGPHDPELIFLFTQEQYLTIKEAIDSIRGLIGEPDMDRNDCLVSLCANWIEEMR